jgi:hypothetical protein
MSTQKYKGLLQVIQCVLKYPIDSIVDQTDMDAIPSLFTESG